MLKRHRLVWASHTCAERRTSAPHMDMQASEGLSWPVLSLNEAGDVQQAEGWDEAMQRHLWRRMCTLTVVSLEPLTKRLAGSAACAGSQAIAVIHFE